MKRRLLLTFFGVAIYASCLMAQQKSISGKVVSSSGEALANVTVVVQGTNRTVKTNDDGSFTIQASPGEKLLFRSVGNAQFVQEVGSSNVYTIRLASSEETIDEVLVTAEFGLKRVARAVGSSVQQIDGATISESGRENFISALAGRVPGLNVTSTGGSPGSSTTVVLRNITSISGNNQPLYVVDGVPMNNSSFDPLGMAGGGGDTYSVRNLDFSNRGSDFNPEDIESITVLKGAAAAALYGSDASN